ncbi:hypothetical protein [Nonlabens ponticola]|uniref:Uncharacterized protein n=1 Tax=Nonlabens ponticola TaxID=2496866 RepID=A0A3S9MV34_9FLAO|nr:hypothetical protein [Nonlabens ponticola]AZQ43039.1 hypothetical protein EJ995_01880 [Nonlabens ponticola]
MALFNSLKSIACQITGHKLVVSDHVTDRVQELCCKNCGIQMTTNIYGDIVPLNDRYSRINHSLRQIASHKKALKIAG